MKQINVYFEDKEYEELLKTKKDKSWREFILSFSSKTNQGRANSIHTNQSKS